MPGHYYDYRGAPARPQLDAADFQLLGQSVAKIRSSRSEKVTLRRFKAEFGVPPDVIADVWDLLLESKFLRDKLADTSTRPPNPEHLLWSLMFLKKYSLSSDLAKSVNVDEKTYRKWCWIYIDAIANLDKEVVRTQPVDWLLMP